MKNITRSFKVFSIATAVVAFCTTTSAIGGEFCAKGGYIKRVIQGWPHDLGVISITLRDENGNETNWATSGSGDVNGHAWTRALQAMALTAYTNQTYVFPTVASGSCSRLWGASDGKQYYARWEGLVFASGQGTY